MWSKRIEVRRATKSEELSINFISQDFGKPYIYWPLIFSHDDPCSTSFRRLKQNGHFAVICFSSIDEIPKLKEISIDSINVLLFAEIFKI